MFLELPAGSIVLFPSAIITHENIGISEHEEREALTAFSPARVFQWEADGFDNVPDMTEEERHAYGQYHWRKGKARLPHVWNFF
jgi:hypothetical protein